MNQPSVCCIALTADRQEFTDRAVRIFNGQTYENKSLLIWDTGKTAYELPAGRFPNIYVARGVPLGLSIGTLRNFANEFATSAEILIHWDVDDWSAPNRVADQVAHLQASGKHAVGYREMLFWDRTKAQIEVDPSKHGPGGQGCLGTVRSVGEAWLYDHGTPKYCVGTSLCYWREIWEAHPFPSLNCGEDTQWLKGVTSAGLSIMEHGLMPRMIAEIHGGNTASKIVPGSIEFTRAAHLDEIAREILRAA